MKFIHMITGPVKVNTFIIHDGNRAAIIDPGGNLKRIVLELESNRLTLEKILLTHGHYDHIGAVAGLKEMFHAQTYIHSADEEMLHNNKKNLSAFTADKVEPSYADVLIADGDVIDCAGTQLQVLHTPGHTQGCVCFKAENEIFTGDTLFYESVGRTDFPGGNYEQLMVSIKDKLFTLESDYQLYPGHDDFTTLEHERKYNPMLGFGWDK